MPAPALSWLFITLGKVQAHPLDIQCATGTVRSKPQSIPATAISLQGLLGPTLRANPFPEVTDLLFWLPLSIFFYQIEAINLGDLMRLWVWQGVQISHATGFSRDVKDVSKYPKVRCLYQHYIPISGQSEFRDVVVVKQKRELFSGLLSSSPVLLVLPLNIHVLVQEY